MIKSILAAPFFGALLCTSVVAQSIDCDLLADRRLFNTLDTRTSQSLIARMKNDICDRDFSSLEEATSSLREGGWDLEVFDLFDNSLKDKKSAAGEKYQVSNSEFCDKSASDLAFSFGDGYREVNGKFVLDAFVRCAELQNRDVTYMEYKLQGFGEGQQLNAMITRRHDGDSPLPYQLSGLTILPRSESAQCEIGGQAINPDDLQESPIGIDIPRTNFSCVRPSDEDVTLAIQTSQGSFEVFLPSTETSGIYQEIENLEADVQTLNSIRDDLEAELVEMQAALSGAETNRMKIEAQLSASEQKRQKAESRSRSFKLFRLVMGSAAHTLRTDFSATCGTNFSKSYYDGLCKQKDLTYTGAKSMGASDGGNCGYKYIALLCAAVP